MSDGMNISRELPQSFKPNVGKQQSKEEALAAIKAAAQENAKHASLWFGKKYLVLRSDETGNKYLDVDTLTWGEWLASKFGKGGGKLQNITEFLAKQNWQSLESDAHLQEIVGKYLKKNVYSLADASIKEKVAAAKTILAISKAFSTNVQLSYETSVEKSLRNTPIDVLLPSVRDALKEGNTKLAVYLLECVNNQNSIKSKEGLLLLKDMLQWLTQSKRDGMEEVADHLIGIVTDVEDPIRNENSTLMAELDKVAVELRKNTPLLTVESWPTTPPQPSIPAQSLAAATHQPVGRTQQVTHTSELPVVAVQVAVESVASIALAPMREATRMEQLLVKANAADQKEYKTYLLEIQSLQCSNRDEIGQLIELMQRAKVEDDFETITQLAKSFKLIENFHLSANDANQFEMRLNSLNSPLVFQDPLFTIQGMISKIRESVVPRK